MFSSKKQYDRRGSNRDSPTLVRYKQGHTPDPSFDSRSVWDRAERFVAARLAEGMHPEDLEVEIMHAFQAPALQSDEARYLRAMRQILVDMRLDGAFGRELESRILGKVEVALERFEEMMFEKYGKLERPNQIGENGSRLETERQMDALKQQQLDLNAEIYRTNHRALQAEQRADRAEAGLELYRGIPKYTASSHAVTSNGAPRNSTREDWEGHLPRHNSWTFPSASNTSVPRHREELSRSSARHGASRHRSGIQNNGPFELDGVSMGPPLYSAHSSVGSSSGDSSWRSSLSTASSARSSWATPSLERMYSLREPDAPPRAPGSGDWIARGGWFA